MKMTLRVILLLFLIGGIVAYIMYNKPHENIGKASVDLKITAEALFADFEADEMGANEKYLDKLIQVSGKVQDSSTDNNGITKIILESGGMFGVVCQLDELTNHERTEFDIGSSVSFKGKCTGINMDVLLVRCVEVIK
ncbi:OB-fold putative lipoprotein [bacterium]|nr:OB-fold putative lipoprotein [bacterium]